MKIGLQTGFEGMLLGAELLKRVKELGFEIARVEAGLDPAAAAGEVIAAGMTPLVICHTLEQMQALPPEAMVEVGNEPDLTDFLDRDFGGSVATWRAVCMAAVEHHLDTGRTVFLGAVSNLNNRGFAFLQNLDWQTIPPTVGCSFHRYPEKGSYTAGHDGRTRAHEYDALLLVVRHDRPLALTETGYSKVEWKPRSKQAEALAYERAFWQARIDRVQFAIVYQINDGPSDGVLDGYGFRDTAGRWKHELVEAWVQSPDVEPEPNPSRTYEVPIDFTAPDGFSLKTTIIVTVPSVTPGPKPEPIPEPEPEPEPEPDPNLVPIDDEALLEIVDEFRARNTLDDVGGMVDAGSQFGRRIQARYTREDALRETREWITFHYGPRE